MLISRNRALIESNYFPPNLEMFLSILLSFLPIAGIVLADPAVFSQSLFKRGGLIPSVNSNAIPLSPVGGGTYPRLTTLSDGSIISAFTYFQGSNHILTVTKSTDGGQTFNAWGVITNQTNDCDNPNIIELPNGNIVATFRNNDLNSAGQYTFYRITACVSTDGGQSWSFLSQVNQRAASGVNGLWVRIVILIKAYVSIQVLTDLKRNHLIVLHQMDLSKSITRVRIQQPTRIF